MVETAEALANLDDILSVRGVDAVYIGPSDLSVSLGLPPAYDHEEPAFSGAIERVVDACRTHNVVPGIHAGGPAVARRRLEQGFLMIEICDDAGSLARSAAADLKALPGSGAGEAGVAV
jgi:4-hydroxy-2-oxoheptanedioate aldolase